MTNEEIDAAVARSNAAFEAGRFEEGVDALAETGLIEVSVDPVTGEKRVMMTEAVAAEIRRLTADG